MEKFEEYKDRVIFDPTIRRDISNKFEKCLKSYFQAYPKLDENSTTSISFLAERLVCVIESQDISLYRQPSPKKKVGNKNEQY